MTDYLDHNAATPADPRVLERFVEVERRAPGNPGSLHATGRRGRAALEEAREQLAAALQVRSEQVIFLSGGTEANNLAVLGSGDPDRPVLLAPVEHPSVLRAAEKRGTELWAVDPGGRAVVREPGGAVGLICLVHGQNEVGTLQPVDAAADLAGRLGVPLHVDASQSLGRVPLAGVLARADTVTLSPHKAGGLRGTGVLVARDATDLAPLMHGGAQERGLRPGTPSPSLAAATALAVELAIDEQPDRARAMQAARRSFENSLHGIRMQRLTTEPSLPNTLMVRFEGVDGRVLLPALDMSGLEASQGSACSSGSPRPPRVLLAMGLTEDDARACVRFSFSHRDAECAERAGVRTAKILRRLQSASERK